MMGAVARDAGRGVRSGRFWEYFKVEPTEFPIEEDVAVLGRTKSEDFGPEST